MLWIGKTDGPAVRVIYGDLSVKELPVTGDEWKAIEAEYQKKMREAEELCGWLGVQNNHDSPEKPGFHGFKVDRVIAGSPAETAGLRPGDVIRACNESPVRNEAELDLRLKDTKVGEQVTLTIERTGQGLSVHVVLGKSPEQFRARGLTGY